MDAKEYIEEMLRKAYGDVDGEVESDGQLSADSHLAEGALCTVVTDRFERSRAARQRCIDAHGATCAICGFDFAAAYGPEFAGIIQVHHIVPLHELGEAHEVDPVRDLIPVCPNCHVALHSKPGGTYTPAELKGLYRGKPGQR